MKTNSKKKIVVSALAIAMGAALVGSISGSVAWYQYSTRVSAAVAGTSAGTSRNLQVKQIISGTDTDYEDHLDLEDSSALPAFRPVSVVGSAGNLTFKEHLVYKQQYPSDVTTNLSARNGSYAYREYTLAFQCVDNGEQQEKPVYLSKFNIAYTTASGTADITPAVRVEIVGTNSFILSKGNATSQTTTGKLDLNNNNALDKDGYDVHDVKGEEITYANASSSGASYAMNAASEALVDADTDPYDFDDDNKVLTTTPATDVDTSTITIRVWIEGWQTLGSPASAIWSEDYIDQNFEVQMQFACEADLD